MAKKKRHQTKADKFDSSGIDNKSKKFLEKKRPVLKNPSKFDRLNEQDIIEENIRESQELEQELKELNINIEEPTIETVTDVIDKKIDEDVILESKEIKPEVKEAADKAKKEIKEVVESTDEMLNDMDKGKDEEEPEEGSHSQELREAVADVLTKEQSPERKELDKLIQSKLDEFFAKISKSEIIESEDILGSLRKEFNKVLPEDLLEKFDNSKESHDSIRERYFNSFSDQFRMALKINQHRSKEGGIKSELKKAKDIALAAGKFSLVVGATTKVLTATVGPFGSGVRALVRGVYGGYQGLRGYKKQEKIKQEQDNKSLKDLVDNIDKEKWLEICKRISQSTKTLMDYDLDTKEQLEQQDALVDSIDENPEKIIIGKEVEARELSEKELLHELFSTTKESLVESDKNKAQDLSNFRHELLDKAIENKVLDKFVNVMLVKQIEKVKTSEADFDLDELEENEKNMVMQQIHLSVERNMNTLLSDIVAQDKFGAPDESKGAFGKLFASKILGTVPAESKIQAVMNGFTSAVATTFIASDAIAGSLYATIKMGLSTFSRETKIAGQKEIIKTPNEVVNNLGELLQSKASMSDIKVAIIDARARIKLPDIKEADRAMLETMIEKSQNYMIMYGELEMNTADNNNEADNLTGRIVGMLDKQTSKAKKFSKEAKALEGFFGQMKGFSKLSREDKKKVLKKVGGSSLRGMIYGAVGAGIGDLALNSAELAIDPNTTAESWDDLAINQGMATLDRAGGYGAISALVELAIPDDELTPGEENALNIHNAEQELNVEVNEVGLLWESGPDPDDLVDKKALDNIDKRFVLNEDLESKKDPNNIDKRFTLDEDLENKDAENKSSTDDKAIEKPTRFVDEIMTEKGEKSHDSLWKSARTIIEKNPEDFGFKGDASDSKAVYNFAERMTATLVSEMDDVKDLVHNKDVAVLEKGDDNKWHLGLEEKSGIEAGHLDDKNVSGSDKLDAPEGYELADGLEFEEIKSATGDVGVRVELEDGRIMEVWDWDRDDKLDVMIDGKHQELNQADFSQYLIDQGVFDEQDTAKEVNEKTEAVLADKGFEGINITGSTIDSENGDIINFVGEHKGIGMDYDVDDDMTVVELNRLHQEAEGVKTFLESKKSFGLDFDKMYITSSGNIKGVEMDLPDHDKVISFEFAGDPPKVSAVNISEEAENAGLSKELIDLARKLDGTKIDSAANSNVLESLAKEYGKQGNLSRVITNLEIQGDVDLLEEYLEKNPSARLYLENNDIFADEKLDVEKDNTDDKDKEAEESSLVKEVEGLNTADAERAYNGLKDVMSHRFEILEKISNGDISSKDILANLPSALEDSGRGSSIDLFQSEKDVETAVNVIAKSIDKTIPMPGKSFPDINFKDGINSEEGKTLGLFAQAVFQYETDLEKVNPSARTILDYIDSGLG